ncbi:holin-like protein CidA [Kurthia zopfii]|uniref:Holin-like protein n=1 Tax=Kurthia zopfii TaxID=1650 RepID=A0A8B4QAR3_9BACL|nr:CidA/LrgA family holin-like protein [Kurthia zopfii]PWI22927.1 murein hydrolase regulator LrgA [Kurthia zopfii]TDR40977.1 holin-like protein [Kurthia zopfii]GEK30377.1 holin-like protein CidA [Kurthia zopfii]STX09809.1 holin-like protein [Kurthia zopfii]
MKAFRIIIQIIIIYGYLLIGEWITYALHLKIPGSIIALFLLFFSLYFKLIKVEWVEAGAGFLTAELLLFFIPAAVGVINYREILGFTGIKLVLIIFLSTIIVMACTGTVAQLFEKRKQVDQNARSNC